MSTALIVFFYFLLIPVVVLIDTAYFMGWVLRRFRSHAKKRKGERFGKILFAVTAVMFLWLEFFPPFGPSVRLKEVSCTPEEILAEMPEMAFTDADLALLDAVMNAPEAALVWESDEVVTFSPEAAAFYTADYLGKPCGDCRIELYKSRWNQSVSEHIIFSGTSVKELSLYRCVEPEKTDTMYKTVRIYRTDGKKGWTELRLQYSNKNGVLTKEKSVHDWFEWMETYHLMFYG